MASLVFCMTLSYLLDLLLGSPGLLGNFFNFLYVRIYFYKICQLTCQQLCLCCSHVVQVQNISCSTTGIILLHFITIPPVIVISSLNDQYSCRSFCISALVHDQPWSMSFDSMPMCSSSPVATHLSSAVMQSGISMHDSIALKQMLMLGISFISACLMVVS